MSSKSTKSSFHKRWKGITKRQSATGSDASSHRKNAAGGDNEITDGERLLARELQTLSLEEREKLLADIHGIREPSSSDLDNATEMVQASIHQLEGEISRIRKKDAYNKAAFLSPRSVRHTATQINMLRKADWNPKAAAKLYVRFFDIRLELFGENALARPVVMEDLPLDAQRSIQAGAVIFKHDYSTDTAGRTIMILNYKAFQFESGRSMLQSIWYLSETIQASAENPPREYVMIANVLDAKLEQLRRGGQSTKLMTKLGLADVLPMEMSCAHLCFENPRFKPIISFIMLAAPKEFRLRHKNHFGSLEEIVLDLRTYGIPTPLLSMHVPDPASGKQADVLRDYLQLLSDFEAAAHQKWSAGRPSHCIQIPTPNDILMGRGKPYQFHPGNVQLTKILEQNMAIYREAPCRVQKTEMSEMLVSEIKSKGMRFLRRDETGNFWEEIPDEDARARITMTLRNLSRGDTKET